MEKKLPSAYRRFATEHPKLIGAYEAVSEVSLSEGPLPRKTAELVKIGIAIGARLEGAVHSHVKRALDAGATPAEIRHAVRLAITTVGFPTMMAALSWTNDVLAPEKD
jgi:AhpD family alkylhydroperoxidase